MAIGGFLLVTQIIVHQLGAVHVPLRRHHGFVYLNNQTQWVATPWVKWPWSNFVFRLAAPWILWLVHYVSAVYRQSTGALYSWTRTVWQVVWLLFVAVRTQQPMDQMLAWSIIVVLNGLYCHSLPPRPVLSAARPVEPPIGDDPPTTVRSSPTPMWTQARFDRGSRYRCSFASLSTDIDWQQELASISDQPVSADGETFAPSCALDLHEDCRLPMGNSVESIGQLRPPQQIYQKVAKLILVLLLWVQLLGRWQHWTCILVLTWMAHGSFWLFSCAPSYWLSVVTFACQLFIFW
jgi:hypothetical protein